MNKFFSKLQQLALILLAYLFACYSFADMGIYQEPIYGPDETYKQYGVLPEGFFTSDDEKVYYDGIIYTDKITCKSTYSKIPDCGTGKSFLFVEGNLYIDDRVKEFAGHLYKSGGSFYPRKEYENDPLIIEKINESKKRNLYTGISIYFIHKGVLYDEIGIKAKTPATCEDYQDGPVICVFASSLEADGEIYKYRLENKDQSLFSRFSGFDRNIYYDNDIRYSGEYCYKGIPYKNFKEYNGRFKYYKCIRWLVYKSDGPGWYSFWDHVLQGR